MGRLFDAVAALIGIRQLVNYEAQGAIELEALVDPDDDSHYSVQVPDAIPGDSRPIDPTPIFHGILKDLAGGISLSNIAARFHNSIAIMSIQACENLRSVSGLNQVFLSGGVWQNMTLLDKTVVNLKARNFKVYIHRRVPANDGGLALGQAIVASQKVLS
jgi:hydrogenase maturation protein HypF